MKRIPDKAFILAAGKGTRLRPHTDVMPKPMVDIAGKSIIRRTLEKLAQADVKDVVINIHHLAPVLKDHLEDTTEPHIIFSEESELLETGGGIKNALHHFGSEPFYVINGDALWEDLDESCLQRLKENWDDERMDILLLLHPVSSMTLTGGVGDYHLSEDGRAHRARDKNGAYMFAGIRIAHPRIFENSPEGAFSFLSLMDKAEEKGRLYGLPHQGQWHHISTPEDLASVNAHFRDRA